MATSPPHVIGFAAENIPPDSWGKVWVAGYFPLDGVVDQRLRALESLWLASEVASRRARGQTWPAEVRCLLIALPFDGPSRVWVNEEVELRGTLAWKWEPLTPGSPVAADQVVDLLGVELPQIQTGAGWILIWRADGRYHMWLDARPCTPPVVRAGVTRLLSGQESESSPVEETEAPETPETAQSLLPQLARFVWDYAIAPSDTEARRGELVLRQRGWWPAVALFPQPWRRMCQLAAGGDAEAAERLAADYLTRSRVAILTGRWWSIAAFVEQRELIECGIRNLEEDRLIEAAHVLVPRIEGVLARAILDDASRPEGGVNDKRRKKAVKRFLAGNRVPGFVRRELTGEFATYLEDHFFASFRWSHARSGREARSRTAVAHGAQAVFSRAFCLQCLLALDGLAYLIAEVTPTPPEPEPDGD